MENKKIIDYDIVANRYSYLVVGRVKELVSEGWQPFGNPVSIGDGYNYFAQAMVKYERFDGLLNENGIEEYKQSVCDKTK